MAASGRTLAGLARAPAPPPEPTREAVLACELVQRRPLQRKSECCGGAPLTATLDSCVQSLDRALVAGRVAIDAAALARCEEASLRERLGCDWVTPGVPMPPAECRSLLIGRVAAGGACHSSLECSAPLHCAGATPSEPGVCSDPLALGAACARTSDALASVLMSDVEREHPICAGTCSFGAGECQAPVASSLPASGPKAQPGEACENDFDCALGGCDASGHCGMKCSVSLEGLARFDSSRALVMQRSAY